MSFPASPVPSECSDFLLPVPPRFVSSRDGTAALDDGDRRISQVPGEPRCVHAPLSDPGGTAVPGPLDTAARPSACCDGVGSHEVTLSRLNHAACMLPVYASRPQLPAARATLGSGCGPALPDGIGYPLGSSEKFPSSCHHYMTSPFPRLVLAHVGIGRRPRPVGSSLACIQRFHLRARLGITMSRRRRPPHRSGLAQLRHPAPHVTDSLLDGKWNGPLPPVEKGSAGGTAEDAPTTSLCADCGDLTTLARRA